LVSTYVIIYSLCYTTLFRSIDGVGTHARRIDDSPTRRGQTPRRGEVRQEPATVESLPATAGSATAVDGAALPRLGQRCLPALPPARLQGVIDEAADREPLCRGIHRTRTPSQQSRVRRERSGRHKRGDRARGRKQRRRQTWGQPAGPLGTHRSLGCPVHRQQGELGPRPRSRSPTVLTACPPRRNAAFCPDRSRRLNLIGTETRSDDPPLIASAVGSLREQVSLLCHRFCLSRSGIWVCSI